MKLDKLIKSTVIRKKRIGRGHGSGKVKTGGRGQKGQKARGTIKANFEGGQLPLTKRLPFKRGKDRNRSLKNKEMVINLAQLSDLPKDTVVDAEFLVSKKLINADEKNLRIKLLGTGEVKVALTIKLKTSKSAKEKIEKAGGTVL